MTEALDTPSPISQRGTSPWAVVASALLNLLFLLLLLWVAHIWQQEEERIRQEQQAVEVDLAPPPEQPKPPPPQTQPQPKQDQPKPEEKKPEEKKPDQPKPPEEKKPEPKQDQKRPLVDVPAPQLQAAPIREKSATNQHQDKSGANGDTMTLSMGEGPKINLFRSTDPKMGPEGSNAPAGDELSQSEQDAVLSQILPFFKLDTHRPEAKGMVLEARIMIGPDGMMSGALNPLNPWNPGAVIEGYPGLLRLGYTYRRESLEAFLLAIRLSQPLKVPPGGKFPKWMVLRFKFDDL